MARPSPDEIKKQLEEQDHEVYGEEAPGGSASSDPMDIDMAMGKVVGDDFDTDDEPEELDLAGEIDGDEQVLAGLGDDDDDDVVGPNPYEEED